MAAPAADAALACEPLDVHALDLEARGIARRSDGKIIFIEGALPFERVQAQSHRRKAQWEQATLTQLLRASPLRTRPACPHFGFHSGACGGCKMQHLESSAQLATKQRVLEDNLWHLAKVRAATVLRPVAGPDWGYRYRARLSVRYVPKKDQVLIGFHERNSRYVADMDSCRVLPAHVSAMLPGLRALFYGMEARSSCPQLELACTDDVTALVLRHLEPLSGPDLQRLRDHAADQARQGVALQWWLQAKGPDTVQRLDPDDGTPELAYHLPEFDIEMPFRPTDFTQVNPHINRVLVARALRLLDVRAHERVIDWFCGLGNFTLPLARQAAEVLGVEGSATLVQRAQANARHNQARAGVARALAPVSFVARNLFEMDAAALMADGQADKWLIDPPREGAFALCKALADAHQMDAAATAGWRCPARIVYVSCNPATLARDAGLLVHQAGYRCSSAGVVNMFPHTAHVESVAVFDRPA